jgi:hypothetical protein
VTVADNDAVALRLPQQQLHACDAAGCGSSYTLALGSEPTAPVTVRATAVLGAGGGDAESAPAVTVSVKSSAS